MKPTNIAFSLFYISYFHYSLSIFYRIVLIVEIRFPFIVIFKKNAYATEYYWAHKCYARCILIPHLIFGCIKTMTLIRFTQNCIAGGRRKFSSTVPGESSFQHDQRHFSGFSHEQLGHTHSNPFAHRAAPVEWVERRFASSSHGRAGTKRC
jgi:hypothetical protein